VDTDAVRTFVAVADTGQFSRAADDLSITQQAVSKRVAVLEKDLGVRLFIRTARGARLTVDAAGPDFGTEPLLDTVAGVPALATFVGEQTHLIWPGHYDLRRIAVRDPAPVYPHSLIWRTDNPHPAVTMLRDYLGAQPRHSSAMTWTPGWAQPPADRVPGR
jgi:Bacterial regulatory helix-turn-helix protein, lysR family